ELALDVRHRALGDDVVDALPTEVDAGIALELEERAIDHLPLIDRGRVVHLVDQVGAAGGHEVVVRPMVHRDGAALEGGDGEVLPTAGDEAGGAGAEADEPARPGGVAAELGADDQKRLAV